MTLAPERSYISCDENWDTDEILVWERPVQGGSRTARKIKPPRYFYFEDPGGDHVTIDGRRCTKIEFDTDAEYKETEKKFRSLVQLFESDVRPLARVLMDEYYGRPTPIVHYAFLDIEVDYSSKLGFSSPENPYAPINAITIYQSWTNKYLTYVVPPRGWRGSATFQADIAKMWDEHKLAFKPNVTICQNEQDLLLHMLGDIEDADIVSGWNSEFFDIPYIMRRLTMVLDRLPEERERNGRAFRAMSFVGAKAPKRNMIKRFGTESLTYTLYGRTHLDYLDLFKKFTFEGRASYSLGNIAAEELDIPKLDYPGTLEELYNGAHKPDVTNITWENASSKENKLERLNAQRELIRRGETTGKHLEEIDVETKNHSFCLFCCYNARDVEVLVKLDLKFKLMQLVNQMAHENTVPFMAILGTVRYVETGIMNRAKYVHGLVCTNKVIPEENNKKVEGAIVMTPLAGLHDWLGSVDITSLYPSVIRALNMSVETFFGQFIDLTGLDDDPVTQLYGERAWRSIRSREDTNWTAQTAEGLMTKTGAEWADFIIGRGLALSAFGTLFDQSKPGMVADTLTFWFEERKRLQTEKKKYAKEAKRLREELGVRLDPETIAMLKAEGFDK